MTEKMTFGLMMDDYQLTLTPIVERAEQLTPERKVVSRRPDGSIHRTTLGETARRARRAATALKHLRIGDGDRVATLLWNQPEHLELYFAIPLMGAVLHTLNPRLSVDELSFIVSDANDRAIVVDESLLDVFEKVRITQDFEHVIVVSHSRAAPDGTVGAAAASEGTPGSRRVPDETLAPDGTLDYESLIANAAPAEWQQLDERRAAAMCYTSGTTGRPKGVVYSHRALVLHSLVAALPDTHSISGRDTILPVVPMFHANGWGLPHIAAFAGTGLVLPGPRLDAESVLELLAAEQVTITAGVPTVWMAILQALDAEPDRWDLTSLRHLIVGGSAAPRSMVEGFDRHGLTIIQAWGMTETSPMGSICRCAPELDGADDDERYEFRARQGIPTPFVEIRARGEDGQLIPWNDEAMGELEVRGPWVASAYHGGRGAERFTADGWFQTGDIVRIDRLGCIKIADRSKDLVKSGGEWISSVDLENNLMAHPAVAEAAVIAMPDEKWGERPLAVVVLCDGVDELTSDEARDHLSNELRGHLSNRFAKWQLPDCFEFVDAIPRTATGKFKKTELRERFVAKAAV